MKNNLNYFAHSAYSFGDRKIKLLCSKYGLEGYARFWIIMEIIAQCQDCKLDLKKEIELLNIDLGWENNKIFEFIEYAAKKCQLFEFNDGIITCGTLDENYDEVKKKRTSAIERAKKARTKVKETELFTASDSVESGEVKSLPEEDEFEEEIIDEYEENTVLETEDDKSFYLNKLNQVIEKSSPENSESSPENFKSSEQKEKKIKEVNKINEIKEKKEKETAPPDFEFPVVNEEPETEDQIYKTLLDIFCIEYENLTCKSILMNEKVNEIKALKIIGAEIKKECGDIATNELFRAIKELFDDCFAIKNRALLERLSPSLIAAKLGTVRQMLKLYSESGGKETPQIQALINNRLFA